MPVDAANRKWRWALLLGTALILGGVILGRRPPERASGPPPQAYVMLLNEPIGRACQANVRRELDAAIQAGVPVFILELDAPGGTIAHLIGIADMLFRRDEIKTVAYVSGAAYGGGTMLALACDQMFINRREGSLGTVVPSGLEYSVRERKAQAIVRSQLTTYAGGRYPQALVEAMFTPQLQVWRLDPRVTPSPGGPAADTTVSPAEPRYISGVEFAAMSDEERRPYKKPVRINSSGQVLWLNATEAEEYGFAEPVDSLVDICAALGIDPARIEHRLP
jgi:ATP-dependent protease ClpP protease subunit